MDPSDKQKLQDFLIVLTVGFLGMLIALFLLYFIHSAASGRDHGADLISFFGSNDVYKLEAWVIVTGFSFLGIIAGFLLLSFQEIRYREERIRVLKESDKSKTEFVSLASHQLRTPLTSMKASTSMMLEGFLGKLTAKQKKVLSQNMESIERLVVLISNLLDVSRIEQQRFQIRLEPFSLHEVQRTLGKIVVGLKIQARKKNITLEVATSKLSDKRVLLDMDKICQIFQNLLENGLDYTLSGGKVRVGIEENHESLTISFSDNGIGIPKKEQKKIFIKFYRAVNAKEARSSGTGIGLYLCKTYIELQKGKIWFVSKEKKGTTFYIRFPLHEKTSVERFLKRL